MQYVAVCCSVLQCAAVCCSVLQCVAVCCSVLQCVAECCSVLQCVAVCCSVLQCVALCCTVLQCIAVHCSVLPAYNTKKYLGRSCCSVLHHQSKLKSQPATHLSVYTKVSSKSECKHSSKYQVDFCCRVLQCAMGWLCVVDSLKLHVSFAKEPYKRDDILQKRPIILRSLLIVATPYYL